MKKYYFALILTLFVLPFFAQNIPSYVPKDGLVGLWPFNGNANDESGNGNHGTNNGATLTTDRNGVANSAYSFDGSSSSINSVFQTINNSVTLSFWFYTNSNYSNGPNFIETSSQYCSINQNDGSIDFAQNTSVGNVYVNSGTIKVLNNWHNIIMIYTSDSAKLYIDGILKDSKFSNGTLTPINKFILGKRPNNTGFFKGTLDDVVIWNRVLSQQEITTLYTGCTSETATSSNFNSLLLSTGSSVSLSAEPQGGVFSGASIDSNKFVPSKAKIGANKVQYNFKNSQGCNDSTLFTMIVADTVGMTCKKYDTVIVPKTVTKYDTITVTNTVTKYDTVKINKYDTITITNNVTKYDTVKVNTYDTITVTNTVTKYDTVIVNQTKYDTITVTDTVNILKINFKLTTGIKANQMTSMSIYPNPTSDVLIIDASDLAAVTGYSYRILDVLGKEVYNALVTAAKTEISLKTLGAKGMYVLHILDANKQSVQTKQIILE